MKVPHLKDQLIGKALYLIPGYSFMHASIFSVDLLTNRLSTHKVRFEPLITVNIYIKCLGWFL